MQTASSVAPKGLCRTTTSRPCTGSPSAPVTPNQAGSRTMSKPGEPGKAARHCAARPVRSSRCTSTPRSSSLRRLSRRELVMRTPRESLSMASQPGRKTVRTEEVGCQSGPPGPRSWRWPVSYSPAMSGRWPSWWACQGCIGSGRVPAGAGGAPSARRAASCSAGTVRPRSVQAEAAANTSWWTAVQWRRNAPRSSGE